MENSSAGIKINPKQVIAFFAMIVGMFMAILDIQVVASSVGNSSWFICFR